MPVKSLFKGLGDLLGEIPLDSVEANPDTSVALEDLVTLTSYNLMPKEQKTIIVPGSPSIWRPRTLPARIKPDSGSYPVDPSRIVFPKCPLEPLLRALLFTHPNYNLSDIDLISDRRNLRLLLDFINGDKSEFRIDVEVIGSTVLFSTWTERATVFVKKFVGYGREFEKAWTKTPAEAKGSVTHNRIVRYSLGGLKVVMRFEVDGCMGDDENPSQESTGTTDTWTTATSTRRSKRSHKKPGTPTNYTILGHGTLTAASRIIEIKTGPVGKDLASPRNLAQLWFSQTPILCTGQYRRDDGGAFSHVSVRDMLRTGELARWEELNRESLRRLVRLLERVREVVGKRKKREEGRGKCVLVLPQGGRALRVYERDGGGGKGMGVPADLVERWGERQ
ncbi:MAG: hypothetical protein M1813_002150 [Trichoglossum hirsutum]|nr:MAG: hypothetical protein M1813_002150 [Trichoglossum hirsutum]